MERGVEQIRSGVAATADRRVRVTAIRVLVFEAAAEIAAPGRKRGTPTCTGPDTAHPECGWKRGERRKPESTTAAESKTLSFSQAPYAWNGFSKTLLRRKNIVKRDCHAPPVGRRRGGKKTRQKPEFSVDRGRPSHGRRGDAEESFSAALGGVSPHLLGEIIGAFHVVRQTCSAGLRRIVAETRGSLLK